MTEEIEFIGPDIERALRSLSTSEESAGRAPVARERASLTLVRAEPGSPAVRGTPAARVSETRPVSRSAFGRLLELLRRDAGLSLSQLASKIGVEEDDLARCESVSRYDPLPRTVYQISQFFKLEPSRLAALANAERIGDSNFAEAAVRFAARSHLVPGLTKQEREDLDDFLKCLTDEP